MLYDRFNGWIFPSGIEGQLPASISKSVIGLPFGSYTGFASTSICDVRTAGYDAPERGGVALAGASVLITGYGERRAPWSTDGLFVADGLTTFPL